MHIIMTNIQKERSLMLLFKKLYRLLRNLITRICFIL